jgi:subtilase family serine protease
MRHAKQTAGHRPSRVVTRAIVACSAAALVCAPALLTAADPSARDVTAFASVGWVPHVARSAVPLGPLAPHATGDLRLDVVLKPRHADALKALAAAVSTPGSPSFRHYLTPAQFRDRFGASQATIDAVKQTLHERGLHVTGVSANRLLVHMRGTARTIERALHVSLTRYRLPDGTVGFANRSAPVLPRDVAASVSSIVGLDSLAAIAPAGLVRAQAVKRRTTVARTPAASSAGPQLSTACAADVAAARESSPSLLTSTDIAQAYGFTDLYNAGDVGQGTTVALIEFSSFLASDIATFASCYGITPTVNEIPVDGGPGPAQTFGFGVGDQVEAELDIEAVLSLAPGATIDVYEAPQTGPGASSLDVFTAAIDNPDVQVISTSWGRCEAAADQSLVSAENTAFQQAAAEGKTIVAAAGDSGSEDCLAQLFGFQRMALAVDDPASQQYVTGTGGTTLVPGPPPTAAVWNSQSGATGGGVSAEQAMPDYQTGAAASLGVVSQFSACGSASGNCREVPDVAANAGTPFATYCTEQGREGCASGGWTGFGGTSLASPIWGAFFALTNASLACASKRIGFANPALYAIAGSAAYPTAFSDITQGNNDLGYQNGLYPATVGYDLATGLGSPIAGNGSGGDNGLVSRLCASAGAVPVTTVTGISPDAGPLRGGTKVKITGSSLTGATAVHLGTKKAASFTVVSGTTIVAVAPSGTGSADVTVTTSLGTSLRVAAGAFHYLAAPTIRSLSPSTGSHRGGTRVTVTGTSFVEASAVRFGAKKAASFRLVSPTRITALAPAGTGKAAVTVTTPGGTSPRTTAAEFRYS